MRYANKPGAVTVTALGLFALAPWMILPEKQDEDENDEDEQEQTTANIHVSTPFLLLVLVRAARAGYRKMSTRMRMMRMSNTSPPP